MARCSRRPGVRAARAGRRAGAGIVAALGRRHPDDGGGLAPLRASPSGGMDLVQPMPYTTFQAMLDGFAPKGWLNYHRGQHLASSPTRSSSLPRGRPDIGSPMTQGIVFRHGGRGEPGARGRDGGRHRTPPTWATRSRAGRPRRDRARDGLGASGSPRPSPPRPPAGPTSTSSPARRPRTSRPASARRSTGGWSTSRTCGTRATCSGRTTTSRRPAGRRRPRVPRQSRT